MTFLFILLSLPLFSQTILPASTMKRLQAIVRAEKYLGLRYRSKVDRMVFDCSGFVGYVLSGVDVRVTRSSVTIVHDGVKVKEKLQARPGDVIVFKGRNPRNKRPGHVGLVHHISNDTLYFIHSSTTKGVVMGHLFDPYYAKRFLQIRDVIGD